MEGTNVIKSNTGEIKIEATEVCKRWREYFEVLLNGKLKANLMEWKLLRGLCMR